MTISYNLPLTQTTTTVTSSANPSVAGQAVTYTATVSPQSPGAGTPSGTVTFSDGGTQLGAGTLDSSGTATFSTASLAAGSHAITASYGVDSNFIGSTSAALTQTVNKITTTTTVGSPPNPSGSGPEPEAEDPPWNGPAPTGPGSTCTGPPGESRRAKAGAAPSWARPPRQSRPRRVRLAYRRHAASASVPGAVEMGKARSGPAGRCHASRDQAR